MLMVQDTNPHKEIKDFYQSECHFSGIYDILILYIRLSTKNSCE